ncbi:MAG TPA: integron integrase [Anaerolineales bacterium]|nr:integron integrase [Anaerolineales bacterium]
MAKKLLDQLSDALRTKHYSYRTEETYIDWVRRFILFHNKQHPETMGAAEIRAFLAHLATDRNVAASTQNQALSAILFLYREVLHKDIETILLSDAKRPERLPTVLNREEIVRVLAQLSGTHKLMAQLLYGSGLRLMECVRLRVKDIDFEYKTITVRDGKGEKDRITPMPDSLIQPLQRQLERVRLLHEEDLAAGFGSVYLPNALDRKYPNAAAELAWQYVFPAPKCSMDPRSPGVMRRHHLEPSGLQRSVKEAARKANVQKRVTCHTFRHSFATHLLQNGYDIRTVQDLLGHKDVRTTMIYTHVLQRGGLAVKSPLDT